MGTPIMDRPVVDRPIAGARATLPVVDQSEIMGTAERSIPVHESQLVASPLRINAWQVGSAPRAKHWQFGAQIAIGMVALFLLITLVVVALFSVPSSTLFTVDAGIGLGIVALSLVLSALLALAPRVPRRESR